MNAIKLQAVTKRYPTFTLDSVSFALPTGSVMGFIGQNGAGKSTTIKLILGLLKPDSGEIEVFDRAQPLDRERIGVVFDECCFPGELTARQIGRILGASYRTWSSKIFSAYLARFDLPERKPIRSYSRGMKMKLSIAAALSHDARLLILDEPTSGLDPVVRDEILDIFYDFMQDESHSILISSHITSDLEKICDYITVIHQGRIRLCAEKDQLLQELGILHADEQTISTLDPCAVHGIRRGQFQMQALVERAKVPADLPIDHVSLDDILLFMAKEG